MQMEMGTAMAQALQHVLIHELIDIRLVNSLQRVVTVMIPISEKIQKRSGILMQMQMVSQMGQTTKHNVQILVQIIT